MARDIGRCFDELTRQGRGGCRLDDGDHTGDERPEPESDVSVGEPEPSAPSGRRGGSSGGLAEQLKDMLRKGRDTATSTGRKAADRARSTVTRRSPPIRRTRTNLPPEGGVVWTWVPLTTKQNSREAQIAIGTGDWDPKRRTSYARIRRMLDIDEDRTRREGAVPGRERFDAVVAAVDEYYDVRRPSDGAAFDDD